MSILVVGTVALDTVETPFGKVKDILGGSATYASTSANFFTKVKLVSIAGTDFPQKYLAYFKRKKIDIRGLDIEKGKTFRWSGRYDYDFNCAHTLKTELNLLTRFDPHLPLDYRDEKFIFLANIDPHIQLRVLKQVKQASLIVSDTMNYWIEHEKKALGQVIKKTDILLVNDSEARQLSGESNLIKAAKSLLSLGPQLIIIKRGEYGCLLFSNNLSFCIPAYLLENVLDPTGAGDTFAGALLGYLASHKINENSFKKAVIFGTIMASFTVEGFSLNRLGRLGKKEITARYKQFEKMTRF